MTENCIVKSEIYTEKEYANNLIKTENKNLISKLSFNYPLFDEDGDLVVNRKNTNTPSEQWVEIEHSAESDLKLVGLQIWRGALLLSDFILHLGLDYLKNHTVLELGSGVGLTSIIASKFASHVICTDIDLGSILQLIRSNFERNKNHVKSRYSIIGLNFFNREWSSELKKLLDGVTIVLAADVIYDNDITDAFINTIERLLQNPPKKEIYIALEKRFVFTINDLDSVAPCYEHFLLRLSEMVARNSNKWTASQMDINFPKYFKYDRVKQLVMWKITS